MGRLKKYSLLFGVLGTCIFGLQAQDVSPQVWADIHSSFPLSQSVSLYGDTGYRKNFDDRRNLIYGRINTEWRLNTTLELHGGTAIFSALYPDYHNFEYRFWEGLKIYWPHATRFYLVHLFRLEQRFVHYGYDSQDQRLDRIRWYSGVHYTFPAAKEDRYHYLTLAGEVFGYLHEHPFYTHGFRGMTGVGTHFDSGWGCEIDLVFASSRDLPLSPFIDDALALRFKIIKDLRNPHLKAED